MKKTAADAERPPLSLWGEKGMQKCYLSMHRYKAFLKVAEVGSFTKAAELLGYTQPTLCQMMTPLERELSIDPPIIRTLAVGHQGPPYPAAGGQGVYR